MDSAPKVVILSYIPSYEELMYFIGDKKYVATGVSPFHKGKVDQMLRHGANGQAIQYLKKFRVERTAMKKTGSTAEKEVERLLRVVLPGTPWAGKAHAVGGYIRDEYMGLEAKDLDIVVSESGGSERLTKYLKGMFKGAITQPRQMGANYPIWQITFREDITFEGDTFQTNGAVIEFADTMKEQFPDDTSRQRSIMPGTLEEDIERRDFTTNMLLKDLTTGEIVDMTGVSKNDIENGVLRGHPRVSLDKIFSDDPLRMIRLVRFQAKYGWKIPLSVLNTVKRNAQRIQIVSAERIMGELTKVMKLGKLSQAVRLMKMTGLLKYVLPEVQNMVGVKQPKKFHGEGDVFKHTILVLKNAPATIEGQLAALLHDVGKPASQEVVGDAIRFLGHEDVGAEMAKAILYRLKFDAETIKKVTMVVKNHMRPYHLVKADDKGIRKFIRDLGDEIVDAVLDQAAADEMGSLPVSDEVSLVREKVRRVREAPVKMQSKPVLNGLEIMTILGISPNDRKRLPEVGEAGKYLMDLADEYASRGEELSKGEAEKALRDMK
jgi:tRNA nucleotidyltransferase/poly(A) polymerase